MSAIIRQTKKYLIRNKNSLVPFLITLTLVVVIRQVHLLYANAMSKDFIQTDWSGGATTAPINDAHLLDWNKYNSKTDGVNVSVSGEAGLYLSTAP